MKVYKLKNTVNPGVTIVDIRSKLSNLDDQFINKLPGDLFLIFPEYITKLINPEIFANLYGATWYGVYKGDKISGFWKSLDYLESLTKYTSISIIERLSFLDDKSLDSLRDLQYSGIETSVFSHRNLTKDEKENLYLINPKIIDLAFGFRFRISGKRNIKGMYSRKTSSDKIFFLRPFSISKIRENLNKEVLRSFGGMEIGSFLSSLIPPETHINVRVDEAKV